MCDEGEGVHTGESLPLSFLVKIIADVNHNKHS